MQIVSYSRTTVAGVPPILARCINAKTSHRCECVWPTNRASNGTVFDRGIQWTEDPDAAVRALQEADVVVVHNGKVERSHRPLLAGKAVITMAHNYRWNVDDSFVLRGYPGIVVGQYQAVLREFQGWFKIPNPIPYWEEDYRPGFKGKVVTVCYTPSGKNDRFPPGNALFWHAKGYRATMATLQKLAARRGIRLETVSDGHVSLADSMAMKRRSHIAIDECVTGSYHRNSLEGLSAGCLVINGLGLLPGVDEAIRYCAGYPQCIPFVGSDLDTLEATLSRLIDQGPDYLEERGRYGRRWMERYWDFGRQWEKLWKPVVDRALAVARQG